MAKKTYNFDSFDSEVSKSESKPEYNFDSFDKEVKKKEDSEISSEGSPEMAQASTSESDNQLIREAEGYTPPEVSLQEQAQAEGVVSKDIPEDQVVEFRKEASGVTEKYLSDIDEYPTEAERDKYVKEITGIAGKYDVQLDENLKPSQGKYETELEEDIATASLETAEEWKAKDKERITLYEEAFGSARKSISEQKALLEAQYPNPTTITATGDPENPRIVTNKTYAKRRDLIRLSEKYVNEIEAILKSNDGRGGLSAAELRTKSFEDIGTLGWSKVIDANQLKKIADKVNGGDELSQQETMVLALYGFKEDVSRNVGVPLSYDVVGGVIDMIPYMASIASTGGIGTTVTATTGKVIKEGSKKAITNYAAKGVNYLLGKSAQALAFASTYEGTAQRQVGEVGYDSEGKLTVSEGDSRTKAFFKSYGSTIAEIAIEGVMDDVIRAGKTVKGKPDITDFIRDKTKFGGFHEELLEEFATAVIQAPIEGQSLEETFTPRMIATTVLTVGVMSGGMSAIDYASGKISGDGVAKTRTDMVALGELLSPSTKKSVDDLIEKSKDINDASRKIDQLVDAGKKEKGWTEEDVMTVMNYASKKNQDNAFNEKLKEEQLNEIADEKAKVDTEVVSEEKVAEKAPVTQEKGTEVTITETKEDVKPKIESNEKSSEDETKVDQGVSEEVTQEKKEDGKRKEKVLEEQKLTSAKFVTEGNTEYVQSDNVYLRVDKDVNTDEVVQGTTKDEWSDVKALETKKAEIETERKELKAEKLDATQETEAINILDSRIKELNVVKEEVVAQDKIKTDKVIPEAVEIQGKIDELSKVEKLDIKRKEALQSASDRAARLGNVSFALDEKGKKQAIEDFAGLAVDLAKAGVISIEIGAIKSVEMLSDFIAMNNPKAKGFVESNKKQIKAEIEKMMSQSKETSSPIDKEQKTTEPEVKERKLGKRAIENEKLIKRLRDELKMKGVAYKVKSNKVSIKEANDVANAFIESGKGEELSTYIKNPSSNIEPDVRTAMAIIYYKNSLSKAKEAATVAERNKYEQEALDVFEASMVHGTTLGRGVQSMSMWSSEIGSNPDLIVATTVDKQRKTNNERLSNREGDIEIAGKILTSKEFEELVNKKVNDKLGKLKKNNAAAKEKVKSGKDKMADALSRMASLQGAKKNAVNENKIDDNVVKILIDFADGALDAGVGSTQALITKIKIKFRPYLSPTDIDKVSDKIIKQTRANNRLKKRPKKRDVLTQKELNKVVDDLYNKMAGSTKAQVRKLVRDSIDRLVEGKALDEKSFRDLFASSIGLEVLDQKTEDHLRSVAERLNDLRNMSDNLKKMFQDLEDLEKDMLLAKKKGVESGGIAGKVNKTRKEVDTQIKEYKKSMEAARKANTEVSDFFADDKMTIDLLTTFIQGNLLTPASLLTNISANLSWMPFRGAAYSVGAITDSLLSGVGKGVDALQKHNTNPWIKRRLNSLPSSSNVYNAMGYGKGYVAGFKEGTIEGLVQMVKGQTSDDAFVREVSKAMHPFKAMMNNWEMLSGKERLKLGKFMNNTLESTFGVAPEVVFRILNLGDKPFRRAAEKARLSEIAALKGLKGAARENFMMFPDADSAEQSRQHGLKSTYQQNTAISDLVLSLSKKQKDDMDAMDKFWYGVRKLITTTTIPFVKTPTNVVGEMIEYGVPGVALGKMVNSMVKGNRREATEYFSKAVIGASLDIAIYSLIAAGIFTLAPAGLEDDDNIAYKVKESEYRNKEAWMFNVDAFERYVNGGSTEFQPDDELRSIKRFGVVSALIMGKLEAIRGTAPDELFNGDTNSENVKEYFNTTVNSFIPSMQAALDQSFLSGINTAATALVKGGSERDRWLVNMTKAFSASFIPNTYSAINQYRDGYIRETRDKTLKGWDKNKQEIKNSFRASYFADNGLPTKVTVWGEPVKRVPDGEGVGWILFDITRKKGYGSDFGVKIHELYERTGDNSVLPSQPSQTYKFDGVKIKLPQDMYMDLQMKTGSYRKLITEPFVNSGAWDDITDERKIIKLDRIYKKYQAKLPVIKKQFERENLDGLRELAEKTKNQ